VLWNLLSNALRHSRRAAGSVRLLVCDARAGGQVELHVIDDGQGVDDDCGNRSSSRSLPHIIAVPVWVSTLRASCAKRMAPSSNCRAGPGCRFSSLGEGGRVLTGKAERRPRGELARVLVVDDEADIRELLDLTVARMGLSADCAASVAEARQVPRTAALSAVPDRHASAGRGGLEIVRLIAERYGETPVAVITAFGSTQNAVAALKAGAFDYLAKPVALEQLRSLIKSALSLPRRRAAASGMSAKPVGRDN
jgi:CheY-like chemotaxis protein